MNTYIKYLKPIRLVFPFLMFILLMGCNNLKDLEMRVAKLETEVAALKRGGVGSSTAATLYPKFQFMEEEYDFGEIKDGAIVGHTFRFSNVGEAPLIISKATAACGCTFLHGLKSLFHLVDQEKFKYNLILVINLEFRIKLLQ